MSVQLVLYPQRNPGAELLVDALNFQTMDSALGNATLTTSGNNFIALVNNYPATISGAWYRFINTVNGTPAFPTVAGGDLVINSVVSSGLGTFSGVYQNILGTTAGEVFTLTVNISSTASVGVVFLSWYSSGSYVSTFMFDDYGTQITQNFTAQSDNDTVFVSFLNNTNHNLVITSMQVNGADLLKEWEGQAICDLYEDEEIPLTLSVDNFKNVAEKVQSYSKDFNLPATKRNNKLFGHIFEITRTIGSPYDFNPYSLSRAILKQDGVILFDGSLRLIDIQDREGEISYNVNLFAQTIALADILNSKTFDDIDLSELEHTYNIDVIESSWTGALPLTNALATGTYAGTVGASTTGVLRYPFIHWTGNIFIGASNTPNLNVLEDAFRPCIQVKYLIDRIFSEAGYTYTSSIFSSADFAKLYMDFNWGGSSMPVPVQDGSYTATYKDYNGSGLPSFSTNNVFLTIGLMDHTISGAESTSYTPPDYVNTPGDADRYKIVCTTTNHLYEIDFTFRFVKNSIGTTVATFRWRHYVASTGNTSNVTGSFAQWNVTGNSSHAHSGSIQVILNTGDKLWPEFKTDSPGSFYEISSTTTSSATYNVNSITVTGTTINTLRGEINQWEFIKGIMTMFNLVTLQDESDAANILIEPYADVFIKNTSGASLEDRSIQHDWTDKVDIKDIKLTPLNDLKKELVFKFEEDDDDYAFNVYKRSTRGHLYGSKVLDASGLTLLEGTEEIVASPFAATVCKPIFQQYSDFIIPCVYALNSDGTTENFDNKPRILFDHSPSGGASVQPSYLIPAQNGKPSETTFNVYTFSHLSDIPTDSNTDDYNFGECQLIQPIGLSPASNLFNNYWLPYYNELYNPDTKTMELKVNLSAGDIASFKFSNYVIIKNRAYRVNRIDYKPKDLSTVEFILIS